MVVALNAFGCVLENLCSERSAHSILLYSWKSSQMLRTISALEVDFGERNGLVENCFNFELYIMPFNGIESPQSLLASFHLRGVAEGEIEGEDSLNIWL